MVDAPTKIAKPHRRTPRAALSCTECTRRKLRCSKRIPCTACSDRGQAGVCRRRTEPTSAQRERLPQRTVEDSSNCDYSHRLGSPLRKRGSPVNTDEYGSPSWTLQDGVDMSPTASTRHSTRPDINTMVDSVASDAPVTLEFLALSRGRILRQRRDLHDTSTSPNSTSRSSARAFMTVEQFRLLLKYHEENLTWMHNVVHLPTFRCQSDHFLLNGQIPESCWLALYYAILSMTTYHVSPETLSVWGITQIDDIAQSTYQMSLDALNEVDFAASHQVSTVQAICLLIYVGHNLGQSDRISVLLASAIRIAQCLGMHRLGSDSQCNYDDLEGEDRLQAVVDREVQKRAWWFLVRQDWLQIPFANTYTIHPSQFNTPMPVNCFDDADDITKEGRLSAQSKDVYTNCSYTSVLNSVSVLIWRTQDRMCRVGHPNEAQNGLDKLYEIVLKADCELKTVMREIPHFYRTDAITIDGPPHLRHQAQILSLAMAHKFYSIHRHFQVLSYKNQWFSYSRISCVSIALSSLRNLLSLPDDEYTYSVRNMWTVHTQIVTAAIWIIFELLFASEGEDRMNSDKELEDIIQSCLVFLRFSQKRSRIGRNGVQVIQMLMRAQGRATNEQGKTFNIDEIIRCIREDVALDSSIVEEAFMDFSAMAFEDWVSFGESLGRFEDEVGNTDTLDFGFRDTTIQ